MTQPDPPPAKVEADPAMIIDLTPPPLLRRERKGPKGKGDARVTRAPLMVATALSKLATRYGTLEVLEAARDWVRHIDRQIDIMARHRMGERLGKDEAPPVTKMTTYKRADGELIGDYGWVTELDWFENDDDIWEPLELIEEEWWRESYRVFTFTPSCWTPDEDGDDEETDTKEETPDGAG